MYIVLEGIVGTGKSTQATKLAEFLQQKFPEREVVLTREPGGTEISETIRKVVQGMEFEEEMEHLCEAYLYAASRAQSLRKIVKPVLEKGGIVISDRSFLSSLTNQAFGRDLGFETVYNINQEAIKEYMPDLIFYLEYDIKKGMERVYDEKGDKFERMPEESYLPFYTKVGQGYEFISQHPDFKDRFLRIDASGSEEEVFESITKKLIEKL
jgi:dTMP kinase